VAEIAHAANRKRKALVLKAGWVFFPRVPGKVHRKAAAHGNESLFFEGQSAQVW
jgi:hypothetical protein